MSSIQHKRAANRRGLTLIELVVVLTVLVSLGSLLVPIVGNALTRSHVATCAQNIPAINRMLSTAIVTTGSYGDGWSTGVFDSAATTVGDAAVNDVDGAVVAGGGTSTLVVDQLTTAEAGVLADVGITQLFDHGDPAVVTDYDVTFNNGLTANASVDGAHVIVLTPAQYGGLSLAAPEGRYIWLGIDKSWTGIGTLCPEPPVHFGDTPGAYPNECYSRFGAVFDVSSEAAVFKTVTYNLDGSDAFETADNHIAIHWNEVQQ